MIQFHFFTKPVQAVLLTWILGSLIVLNGQTTGLTREKQNVVPLSGRIGHSDQAKAFAGKNVSRYRIKLHAPRAPDAQKFDRSPFSHQFGRNVFNS